MKTYLAIDIGASSGRHIVAWLEGGKIETREVYRFPNGASMKNGHLCWDIEALEGHVVAGLKAAKEALLNQLRSTHDSPGGIEDYYTTMQLTGAKLTPVAYLAAVEKVTGEQVCRAAQTLTLHTQYVLKGEQ